MGHQEIAIPRRTLWVAIGIKGKNPDRDRTLGDLTETVHIWALVLETGELRVPGVREAHLRSAREQVRVRVARGKASTLERNSLLEHLQCRLGERLVSQASDGQRSESRTHRLRIHGHVVEYPPERRRSESQIPGGATPRESGMVPAVRA